MAREAKTQFMAADDQIPAGAKRVSRTTREDFLEPVGEEDLEDREGKSSADNGGFQQNIDDDPDEELLEPAPKLSAVEKLCLSMRDHPDGGTTVVYAKRKPDPGGMRFKNPSNMEYTAGAVPFDEANPCAEDLELAIQKLYGGGRYQILVRHNGEYAGSAVANIMDAPEAKVVPPAPQPAVQQEAPAPPTQKSPVEEIRASIGMFREVVEVLESARPPAPKVAPQLPPANPLDTLKDAISLVKDMNSFVPNNAGGGGDGESAGATARAWMDGIASIGREFGVGQLLNNLMAYGLNEATRKRAAEDAAARGANGTMGSPGETAGPPPQDAGHTMLSGAPPPPPSSIPGPTIAGFQLEMLPPPMRVALDQALTVVITEIARGELSDVDEYDIDPACEAIHAFIEKFPEAFTVFDRFMKQSSVQLVLSLATIKPEWSKLPESQDAAGFLDEIKGWWSAAAEEAQEVAGEGEAETGGEKEAEAAEVVQ